MKGLKLSLQERGFRTDTPYVFWRVAALMHLRVRGLQ